MGQPVDLIGKRYGRLLAVERTETRSSSGSVIWRFLCDCGSTHLAAAASVRAVKNPTHSCGCIRAEYRASGAAHKKHGKTGTSIHNIWMGMIARCENPENLAYVRYGGRGITVCERWHDFENFYADMGERPDGMSLERVDNNGPYSPENVRWATKKEQANNRRSNRIVDLYGRRLTMAQAAEVAGIDQRLFRKRLLRGFIHDIKAA